MKIKSLGKKEIENYEKIYKEIVTLYSSGTMTMKEIGEKFDITKQRVWQIVRRCKIGNGNYYSAVEIESKKKELPDHLYSAWLKDKGIKTIKRKED